MKCPRIEPDDIVQGDARQLLECLPGNSIDLIITSPPYAGKRGNSYNTVGPDDYKDWFMPFTKEMKRVLKPTGSFVLNIKENVVDGQRHPYVFDTVKAMQQDGWRWTETYIWRKENPYPIKPINRLKDGFEYLFHFTKEPKFKFHPERIMVKSKNDTCRRYLRGVKTANARGNSSTVEKTLGYYHKNNGHMLGQCNDGFVNVYPSNVFTFNVGSNRAFKGTQHPARFPKQIPATFIDMFTDPGDIVLDPFAGSGTTNVASKEKCRRTLGFELKGEYATNARDRLYETVPGECNR